MTTPTQPQIDSWATSNMSSRVKTNDGVVESYPDLGLRFHLSNQTSETFVVDGVEPLSHQSMKQRTSRRGSALDKVMKEIEV